MMRQSLFAHKVKEVKLSLSITPSEVKKLIKERASAPPIKPRLVTPEELKSGGRDKDYNRFKDEQIKDKFRKLLFSRLSDAWQTKFPKEEVEQIQKDFLELTKSIDDTGALIIGDLIKKESFRSLIKKYDDLMYPHGSKSWIHSYLNLGNHPEFLSDQAFKDAFCHPLLIALISYAAGGAIRIVDARAKDAEPLAVRAQDNMLHIDNTPFRREFKIILTWERGQASGPKGQNFVFIPGTHKGVRDCSLDADGKSYSTEDGSIFITPENIKQVFEIQKQSGREKPEVVEVQNPDSPLTTVFEAGALVHHRYRTKEKNVPRSCIIIAFHRAADNAGQFMKPEAFKDIVEAKSLTGILFSKYDESTEEAFLTAISAEADAIAKKTREISKPVKEKEEKRSIILEQKGIMLDEGELKKWMEVATDAPTVEDLKIERHLIPLDKSLGRGDLGRCLIEIMKFDKHGPLDLKLYGDGHEEIRKWARNRAREMNPKILEDRFYKICAGISAQPDTKHLLDAKVLKEKANFMVDIISEIQKKGQDKEAKLDSAEKISSVDAYRSMKQLFVDLGDAIVRCDSRQAFLSTSLFLFLACCEFETLHGGFDKIGESAETLKTFKQELLMNYYVTAILVEKDIKLELAEKLISKWNELKASGVLSPDQEIFKLFEKVKSEGFSDAGLRELTDKIQPGSPLFNTVFSDEVKEKGKDLSLFDGIKPNSAEYNKAIMGLEKTLLLLEINKLVGNLQISPVGEASPSPAPGFGARME